MKVSQRNRLCKDRLLLLAQAVAVALSPAAGFSQEYDELPAAPVSSSLAQKMTLYLTISVNGRTDNQAVPVVYEKEHYFVGADILKKNHIPLPGNQQDPVDLAQIEQVTVHYEPATQQLQLTVPPSWLPVQRIEHNIMTPYATAASTSGLLINYDAYYLYPSQGEAYLATWLEQRVFLRDMGYLSNNGVYRVSDGEDKENRYLRYDTFWRYSDEKNMISYQVGDTISNSLTWSNSVRMGGIRIGRNFGLRPDLITYPLIEYSGSAALPSSLDLFINGAKTSSSTVDAGPFTLSNIPYINGAGEATVVTTDALGRQVSTNVPFYVSNMLLRKGFSDFDISLGALRKDYGIKNSHYSQGAFSGIYRYGLTNKLTLSGHVEGSKGLKLAGAGADATLGYYGILSASYTQSDAEKAGHQYTLGYSYNSAQFGFYAQHSKRNAPFQDLSTFKTSSTQSAETNQVTLSMAPFGQASGTLGAGFFDIRYFDRSRTQLVNLSYSRSLTKKLSMYLSVNKTLGDDGYTAYLQFTLPLDAGPMFNLSAQRSTQGKYSSRLDASWSVPSDGGVGGNLAASTGENHYRQADMTWRTQYVTLQGGVYGDKESENYWADVNGSLLYVDGSVFAANKINDAFIVVSTNGYSNVPVRYENQLIGNTSSKGHLLIPSASAYYPAKISIDTLDLPVDIDIPEVERRVAVKEKSGTLVTFPIKRVLSASVRLVDKQGKPLPMGLTVFEKHSGKTAIVGHDGLVWLNDITADSELIIALPQGNTCTHSFHIQTDHNGFAKIGPLMCNFSFVADQ